jgi:anthranilate phosphoribosyltransferase
VANAGAAVYLAGMADSLAAGVKTAKAAIADGSATAALERLRKALPRS